MNWEDVRAFLAVTRANSLREAAHASGLSAATLGRRVTALERATGLVLVERTASGYRLTAAGRAARVTAERMEAAALDLARTARRALPLVRVAAGAWMSRYLTAHVAALRAESDTFAIEWVAAAARADISRREAHVGLRNARPDDAALAGRRLGTVAFAVYGRATGGAGAEADGGRDGMRPEWLLAGGEPPTPSAAWTLGRPGRVVARVSDPPLLLPLLAAGTGRAVLPCFVGDLEPGLARVGDVVPELAHEQWLVAHHDDRHLDAVRLVIERIAALRARHAALFAGEHG